MSQTSSKKGAVSLPDLNTPTLFDTQIYRAESIATTLLLLTSKEYSIVLKTLTLLIEYVDVDKSNIQYLYDNDILPRLLPLLEQEDLPLLRHTLKFILLLIPNSQVIDTLVSQHLGSIKKIINIFVDYEDAMVKEFCPRILMPLVTIEVATEILQYKPAIFNATFDMLKTTTDPDIQKDTLELLYKLIQSDISMKVLLQVESFSPKLLCCYLDARFPLLQIASLKIVEYITAWKNVKLQAILCNGEIIETMVNILCKDEADFLHRRAIKVLMHCLCVPKCVLYFSETKEFAKFLFWANSAPAIYEIYISNILLNMTRQPKLIQILYDFSAEDLICSYLHIKDNKIMCDICEAVTNLISNRYCCESMLTPSNIERLISIIGDQDIDPIPNHEKAIITLHAFLVTSIEAPAIFARSDALYQICRYYIYGRNAVSPDIFFILTDMFHFFCLISKYKETTMTREAYQHTLELYDKEKTNFIATLIELLSLFIDVELYREYFLELNGPQVMLAKMKNNSTNDLLIRNTLVYIKSIFVYRNIATVFIKLELLSFLKSLREEMVEKIPMIKQMILTIYNLFLPLKFFDTGRLEMHENIRDQFYLIKGKWDEKFLFLEVLQTKKLSTCTTIYIVNLDVSDEVHQILQALGLSLESTDSLDEILPLEDIQLIPKAVDTLTKIPISINSGTICNDPYLAQHLLIIKHRLFQENKQLSHLVKRIKFLAQYVVMCLSGIVWDDPNDTQTKHSHNFHIATLKKQLGTNIIPIGYVRNGMYCERALLFKTLADMNGVPASLVKGDHNLYWNEVPIFAKEPTVQIDDNPQFEVFGIVDLMKHVGKIMKKGSREAEIYTHPYEKQLTLSGDVPVTYHKIKK